MTPYHCSRCGEAMPSMTISSMCLKCTQCDLSKPPLNLLSVIEGKKKEAAEKKNDPYEIMPARKWWLYNFAGQLLAARQVDHDLDSSDFSKAIDFADRLLAKLEEKHDDKT